ncbi:MAG: DUF2271 domain-containing protein [Bacteroidales bacterium]|nr:DUF2271 domain-containing protein [Bacteroidales bacterium]
MKKVLFILALCAVPALMAFMAPKAGDLEISFNYDKKPGAGSNQYAVWIENAQGEVVKTLFVTQFTSKGRVRGGTRERGYTFRPTCMPTWVKHVKAESLSDEQMDAFTGATPASSGLQTFTWDFTDQAGKPVPGGEYRFYVEATYNGPSIVTYSGTVSSGQKAGDVQFKTEYTEESEDRKDMVSNVRVRIL